MPEPPPGFELPRLREKPHDKRLDNLRPGLGRLKGTANKVTRDLKLGITTAAENLGRDGEGAGGLIGYLEFLGLHHPKAFAGLLGKLLPLQVNASTASSVNVALNVTSVPSGSFLTREAIEQLQKSPRVLELAPPDRIDDENADSAD